MPKILQFLIRYLNMNNDLHVSFHRIICSTQFFFASHRSSFCSVRESELRKRNRQHSMMCMWHVLEWKQQKKNVFGPKIKCSVEIYFNFECAKSAECRVFIESCQILGRDRATFIKTNSDLSLYGNSEYVGRNLHSVWEMKVIACLLVYAWWLDSCPNLILSIKKTWMNQMEKVMMDE